MSTLVTVGNPSTIVTIEENTIRVAIMPVMFNVTISNSGPQGPPGAQGPQGEPGSSSSVDTFTYSQYGGT